MVKHARMVTVLSGLLSVLLSIVAVADIYKFTDAEGIVHYTNIKPGRAQEYTTFSFPCYASDPKCRDVDWEQVPLNTRLFRDEIGAAAARYAVDESLIRAIIHAESAYRPDATSPKGAQGLMQLMPETQKELQIARPFDPERNIEGGTYHLSRLLKQFDDNVELATAAYNSGAGVVKEYGGIPPFSETREFVRRVQILYRRYRLSGT